MCISIKPFWPRLCVCDPKVPSLANEARKANLDAHKRIFKVSTIMKVVYTLNKTIVCCVGSVQIEIEI